MLATLAYGLTIDGFSPVSDDAGGIAEVAEFNPEVRREANVLDATGSATAAIGKSFAISSEEDDAQTNSPDDPTLVHSLDALKVLARGCDVGRPCSRSGARS